ncbi:MAG: hypothetical protein Q7S81_00300 [bacterium]|nr:hypothetical protein [bacterium]
MTELKKVLDVKPGGDVFKSEKICLKVLIGRFVKLQRDVYGFRGVNHLVKISPPLTKREKAPMVVY